MVFNMLFPVYTVRCRITFTVYNFTIGFHAITLFVISTGMLQRIGTNLTCTAMGPKKNLPSRLFMSQPCMSGRKSC